MPTSKIHVLPPIEVEDEAVGRLATIPKYTNRSDVSRYDGALAPPPSNYDGPTNDDGEVYYAHVHADAAAHDAIQADGDTRVIGEMPDADLPPSALANTLNAKFRPQNLTDLIEIRGERFYDKVRELEPEEWASRFGGGSGAFSE